MKKERVNTVKGQKAMKEDLIKENIDEMNGFSSDISEVEEKYMCKLSDLLKSMGMAVHIKGYGYARTAILLCIENSDKKLVACNCIYPYVAEKFNTTPSRVERAIRHSIEKLWKENINPNLLKSVFVFSPEERSHKPVNTEFIYSIVEYLKMN